ANLLGHLVCPVTTNNLKCLRYVLESEMVTPKTHARAFDEALNMAMLYQNVEGLRVLMKAKYESDRDKETKEYGARQIKERSQSEELLEYLKKQEHYGMVMTTLCDVMIAMMKDHKKVSNEVLNVCWLFDKTKMWTAMYDTCKQLLQVDSLSEDVHAYKWLEEHLLKNTELSTMIIVMVMIMVMVMVMVMIMVI
ncbi:hypothetical protein RFI_26633, partial [Reticulomyxa filosa]